MEQDIAAQVVGLGGATDFSLWKLFLRADFVVKFVIILSTTCIKIIEDDHLQLQFDP